MSAKSTKLSIKSTSYADEKKTVTDNINYVNPNISNNTAIELAQRLSALTKNSYKSTEKIETTELEADTRSIPSLTKMVYLDGAGASITLNTTLTEWTVNTTTTGVWQYPNDYTSICLRFQFTGISDDNFINYPIPIIQNVQSESGVWAPFSMTFGFQKYNQAYQKLIWGIQVAATRTDVVPETVSFDLLFKETPLFKSFNYRFTFNLTEE